MNSNQQNLADDPAKRLVVLGLLLQALHVLFGFTAIMGMFINHMLIDQSKNTIHHSHIRWQLITFWVSATLYALSFFAWYRYDIIWPFVTVLLFTFYRIAICAYYCLIEKPLERNF